MLQAENRSARIDFASPRGLSFNFPAAGKEKEIFVRYLLPARASPGAVELAGRNFT